MSAREWAAMEFEPQLVAFSREGWQNFIDPTFTSLELSKRLLRQTKSEVVNSTEKLLKEDEDIIKSWLEMLVGCREVLEKYTEILVACECRLGVALSVLEIEGRLPRCRRRARPVKAQTGKRQNQPVDHTDDEVERFRAIAHLSMEGIFSGDGPVSPDWELLDRCAEALQELKRAKESLAEEHRLCEARIKAGGRYTDYPARERELRESYFAAVTASKTLQRHIRKIKAKTVAGIYAKALVVRASRTGAPEMGRSLAIDLIECPGVRQSLWPSEAQAQGSAA